MNPDERAKTMSFEILLKQIQSGEEPEHEEFAVLSDLSVGEAKSLVLNLSVLNPEKRREVVLGLVNISNDDVGMDFNEVFISLLKDQDYIIRSLAISGLWESERPDLIVEFISFIKEDNSDTVRISAVIALGRFAMLAANGKLVQAYSDRIQGTFMEIMDQLDPFDELWRHCLEAVAPFDATWIEDAIKHALASDEYLLRISGLNAVSRSADEGWVRWILDHLKDPESSVRVKAAEACGELESDEAVLYLLPLIQDENEQVRLTTLRALSTIGGDFVNKILSEQQNSDDEFVAEFAKRALSVEGFDEDTML